MMKIVPAYAWLAAPLQLPRHRRGRNSISSIRTVRVMMTVRTSLQAAAAAAPGHHHHPSTSTPPSHNRNEFDFLLQEDGGGGIAAEVGGASSSSSSSSYSSATSRRRMVIVPSVSSNVARDGIGGGDGPPSTTAVVVLASSTSFPGAMTIPQEEFDTTTTAATTTDATDGSTDPYANALDSQLGKIEQYQQQQQQQQRGSNGFLEQKLQSMDLQDIVLTLVIPGILTFVVGRWTYQKFSQRIAQTADRTLDNFASEMIYHDGDFKEMDLCTKDYTTKLLWMGPMKRDAMMKRYLELYAKKKTVSPQAIASLSYVLTIFQYSEEQAARILVQCCQHMGTNKISSIGKLYFFGTHILKSSAGQIALRPIQALIMSTYRDERVAESLVETSQQYVVLRCCCVVACVLLLLCVCCRFVCWVGHSLFVWNVDLLLHCIIIILYVCTGTLYTLC
jgi:hypothetical protein